MRTPKLVVMLLTATGALSACAPTTAVVNGKEVARPSLGYTDHQYFAVKHERAYPEVRGPSSGLRSYAGRIVGDVCGTSVNFEGDYRGRSLDLTGFISPAVAREVGSLRAARLEVRDSSEHGRAIYGEVVGLNRPIELYLRADSIIGDVGRRHFTLDELDLANDELRGHMRYTDWTYGDTDAPFVVRGVRELWDMPPADQAVLMPILFSCAEGMRGDHGVHLRPVLSVDFRNVVTALRN